MTSCISVYPDVATDCSVSLSVHSELRASKSRNLKILQLEPPARGGTGD